MPDREYLTLSKETHQRAIWIHRAQNSIWIWLGIAAMVSFIQWLVDPAGEVKRSIIQRELDGPVDDVWHIMFGIGGLFIAVGVWMFAIRAEIAGHLIFSAAVLINTIAIINVVGLSVSALILFGIFCASLLRAIFLYYLARKIEVEGTNTDSIIAQGGPGV